MTDIPALVKYMRETGDETGSSVRTVLAANCRAAADALEQLHAALREVITTWEANFGRVYESMGGSNPRVAAIEDAMDGCRALVTPPKESAPVDDGPKRCKEMNPFGPTGRAGERHRWD